MKERPILFNGEMVRAIIEGRKTQTRRMIKDFKGYENSGYDFCIGMNDGEIQALTAGDHGWEATGVRCPYGQPGDRLWVRERFLLHQPFTGNIDNDLGKVHVMYYAGDNPRYRDKDKWKPSIHMPRWASRITLEITGVRVERLQDISEKDAVSEGCEPDDGNPESPSPISEFRDLWQSINGAESWAVNPWVWVIEFKKC